MRHTPTLDLSIDLSGRVGTRWAIDYASLNMIVMIIIVVMTIFACIIIVVLFVVPLVYGMTPKMKTEPPPLSTIPDTSDNLSPTQEPVMKTCSKCFTELPPEAIYCSDCGEKV